MRTLKASLSVPGRENLEKKSGRANDLTGIWIMKPTVNSLRSLSLCGARLLALKLLMVS